MQNNEGWERQMQMVKRQKAKVQTTAKYNVMHWLIKQVAKSVEAKGKW